MIMYQPDCSFINSLNQTITSSAALRMYCITSTGDQVRILIKGYLVYVNFKNLLRGHLRINFLMMWVWGGGGRLSLSESSPLQFLSPQ